VELLDICPERMRLLRKWTDLVSDEVRLAMQLDHVSQNTADYSRHKQLIEEASVLGRKATEAKRMYEAHLVQHGCELVRTF